MDPIEYVPIIVWSKKMHKYSYNHDQKIAKSGGCKPRLPMQ